MNRLYHALRLYQEKKVKKILVTGGNGKVLSKDKGEAIKLAQTLIEWGVPRVDIIIENKAQNTYQNAVNSIKLIPDSASAIIITSAFHMYRSKKCFDKLGVSYSTFPTDFYSTKNIYTPQELLFPSANAISRWNIISHEIIGLFMYKLMGYV